MEQGVHDVVVHVSSKEGVRMADDDGYSDVRVDITYFAF